MYLFIIYVFIDHWSVSVHLKSSQFNLNQCNSFNSNQLNSSELDAIQLNSHQLGSSRTTSTQTEPSNSTQLESASISSTQLNSVPQHNSNQLICTQHRGWSAIRNVDYSPIRAVITATVWLFWCPCVLRAFHIITIKIYFILQWKSGNIIERTSASTTNTEILYCTHLCTNRLMNNSVTAQDLKVSTYLHVSSTASQNNLLLRKYISITPSKASVKLGTFT